jgi:hypothetical protein
MSLFAHYEADPDVVRATAADVLSGATKVTDLKVSVDQRHDVAVSATGGVLSGPLVSSVRPFDGYADQTAQCATIAGGAMNLFAKDIDTYNAGIDDLNARYAAAAATGFNVDQDQYYNHGTMTPQQRDTAYHNAVAAAQSSLKSSLAAEEAKLRETLDSEADVVVAVLDKGPSDDAALVLAMNGELPSQARVTFPGVIDGFKTAFDPVAGTYSLVTLSKYPVDLAKAQLALERASLALLQGQNLADADTNAVLRLVGGDATDMAVLNKYFSGEESLNSLRDGYDAAKGARSAMGLVDAAAATSKFAKGVAGLSVLSGIYDIGWNPNDDSGVRRGIMVAGDTAGIVGGAGTLLIAAGIITAPIAAPIVIGATVVAGAIALGTLVYDHWDDIKDGVGTAYNWTKDRLGDAVDAVGDTVDAVGDTVDKAADWADDQAKKIPVIGGLFG